MKVLLAGVGSAGDVEPLLAIGQALQARGHAVELLSNPAHADRAARSGIAWHAVGTQAQTDAALAHPLLWHPMHGFGVMWRYLLRPAVAPVFERIQAVAQQGPCCVVASPVMLGARVARERLGVPLLSVCTAPFFLRSCEDPMSIARWRVPRWLPRWARRGLWRALDRHKLDPLVRPDLQAAQERWQLPPVGPSVFDRWLPSPDGICALFPDWFAQAADWPAAVQQAGFVLFDGAGGTASLPESLQRFLEQGPPPVIFTPGTARRDATPWFEAAVRICAQQGWRGVLVGDGAQRAVAAGPGPVHAVAHAEFSALLPRAAAVVHHGGIGTSAQALRAGIAQLVLPAGYDQFDNGWRLEALGVGRSLTRERDQQDPGPALARLMHDPAVARACAEAARRMDAQQARARVCEQVEGLSWR